MIIELKQIMNITKYQTSDTEIAKKIKKTYFELLFWTK